MWGLLQARLVGSSAPQFGGRLKFKVRLEACVRRREFISLLGGALLLPGKRLHAEHHVVSVNPLEVVCDLNSLQGRYTSVGDFYVRNHHQIPRETGELW